MDACKSWLTAMEGEFMAIEVVRRPAVAGMFYPRDAGLLAREVDEFLAVPRVTAQVAPKALLVPHAGYIYSGPVAASAYALLRRFAKTITRVILLGPSHYVPLRGMAVPACDAFDTPLGRVPVDLDGVKRVLALDGVSVSDDAHLREHSLEVQLPFLQRCLLDFNLLPVVVGACPPDQVARVIQSEWGESETLVVVSTDLSHYLSYDQARAKDKLTADHILSLTPDLTGEQACGCHALNGMLLAAARQSMRIAAVDLRNSGDTAGPADQVVGYGAFALYET
jgi:AmmeMemoRadiSam system protein B